MKNKFCTVFFTSLLFSMAGMLSLASCNSDSDTDNLQINTNPLSLQASSKVVVLDDENPDKEILSFMWEPAMDRSKEGVELEHYLFKMDLAGKNFETTIPKQALSNGMYYKTFTSRELAELLTVKWGITPGAEVALEARIIARFTHPDKFIMPAVSTISFKILTSRKESKPLYLVGTASAAGLDAAKAIEMTEVLQGEVYYWRGQLQVGSYYFIPQSTALYPGYFSNEQGLLELIQSDTETRVPFTNEQAGMYAVVINLTTKRMVCEKVFDEEKLSIIGSGTNWGWPSGSAGPTDAAYGGVLIWSYTNPHQCEITTELKAGEFRIAVAGKSDYAFRPYNAAEPITTAVQDVVLMSRPDYKWKIEASDAGTYQIILDTKNFKININKK